MTGSNLSPRAAALVVFIAEQGYICPWGQAWDGLWRLLPGRKRHGEAWEPALPLILTGWYISSNLDKALRLREHIEWADQHDAIDVIDQYLRDLPAESWHRWQSEEDRQVLTLSEQPTSSHPLSKAADRLAAKLSASGFTEREAEQSPSSRLQATFVPRRQEEPTSPLGNMPIGDDGQGINLFEEGRNDPDQPLSVKAQALWDELLSRGRVCPTQEPWYRLWMSLPCKYVLAGRYMPPEPPHPNHWDRTPNDEKRTLLLRHIRWADQNRVLNKTANYLKNLPEEAWVNVSGDKQP